MRRAASCGGVQLAACGGVQRRRAGTCGGKQRCVMVCSGNVRQRAVQQRQSVVACGGKWGAAGGGQRAAGGRQWAVDSGRRAAGSRLWVAGGRRKAVGGRWWRQGRRRNAQAAPACGDVRLFSSCGHSNVI
jgi:hypothetical protein